MCKRNHTGVKVANKTKHDRRTLFRNQDKPDTAGQEDKENNHLENTADTDKNKNMTPYTHPCSYLWWYWPVYPHQHQPKWAQAFSQFQTIIGWRLCDIHRYNQHIMESSANITSSEESIYCRQEHENIFKGTFFQSCNKSVSWYLGYRTFLEENPDIFKLLLYFLLYLA